MRGAPQPLAQVSVIGPGVPAKVIAPNVRLPLLPPRILMTLPGMRPLTAAAPGADVVTVT